MNNCRFGNVNCIFFEVHAYGVFSNFLAVSQKESSTLLQLREILLRTVGCTGVLPFVVNCQKVQYSTSDWR